MCKKREREEEKRKYTHGKDTLGIAYNLFLFNCEDVYHSQISEGSSVKARRIEGTKLPPLFKILHDSTREIINEGQHSRDRFVDDFFFAVHESGLLSAVFRSAISLSLFRPVLPRRWRGKFVAIIVDSLVPLMPILLDITPRCKAPYRIDEWF